MRREKAPPGNRVAPCAEDLPAEGRPAAVDDTPRSLRRCDPDQVPRDCLNPASRDTPGGCITKLPNALPAHQCPVTGQPCTEIGESGPGRRSVARGAQATIAGRRVALRRRRAGAARRLRPRSRTGRVASRAKAPVIPRSGDGRGSQWGVRTASSTRCQEGRDGADRYQARPPAHAFLPCCNAADSEGSSCWRQLACRTGAQPERPLSRAF
jgi:hypothetical protein